MNKNDSLDSHGMDNVRVRMLLDVRIDSHAAVAL